MRMNIVEPSADHLTLEEAVQLVGLGDKTLRRALQAGELPRCYVVGARGPHLVFLRADVERIDTAAQDRLGFAAFDVAPGATRADLVAMLTSWTAAAEAIAQG